MSPLFATLRLCAINGKVARRRLRCGAATNGDARFWGLDSEFTEIRILGKFWKTETNLSLGLYLQSYDARPYKRAGIFTYSRYQVRRAHE